MTKKDYELIADTFKQALSLGVVAGNNIRTETVQGVVYMMSDNLAKTNPKFDRVRFLQACGICSHPHLGKSSLTGDYFCEVCGETVKDVKD